MGGCSSVEEDGREPLMSLDNLITEARTGDIILMSGRGAFSDVVRLASESEYSHVGIVLRKDQHHEPLLFQSTYDPEPYDLQSKSSKTGPKISLLRTAITTYDGNKIAYRALKTGLKGQDAAAKRKDWTRILFEFQKRVNHLPYEFNLDELANSAMGVENHNDRRAYFCNELVADSWVQMGLLDKETIVNSFTMDNFTSKTPVILNGGAYYEREIVIT